MYVWMMLQLLIPGMQHAEEADFGAEQSRIACEFHQGFGAEAEQKRVDELLLTRANGANSCGKVKTTCT